MKFFKALGIVLLWAVDDVIAAGLALSEASMATSTLFTTTSKSLTAPWDDPTHTPSTFTTISLTYSPYYSSATAQVTSYPTLEAAAQVAQADAQNAIITCSRLDHGFDPENGPRKCPPGRVLQEQSHESLTTIKNYATITLTLSELDTTVLYTGPVDAETMITLDSGTHTITKEIVTTVTDIGLSVTTAVIIPTSPSTNSVGDIPSSIPSSASGTLYGSATLTTQPGLPSVVPATATLGTETAFSSSSSLHVTTTIPTSSVGTSLATAADTSIFSQTHSTTESAAGVAPTSAKKAMGALVGVAGVMVLVF